MMETFSVRTLVTGDGNKNIELTLMEGDIVDKGLDGTIHVALKAPFNKVFGLDKIWINPRTMDIIKRITKE